LAENRAKVLLEFIILVEVEGMEDHKLNNDEWTYVAILAQMQIVRSLWISATARGGFELAR
jgi:hypothetical protein